MARCLGNSKPLFSVLSVIFHRGPKSRSLLMRFCRLPLNGCGPLLLLLLTWSSGCGESRPPLAVAGGRVVCSGIAVTAGSVTFVPIAEQGEKTPGKAAKGEVTGDGSFRLTTWDAFDGAIVGRHRVEFEVADAEEEEEEEVDSTGDGEQEEAPRKSRPAAAVEAYHLPGELIVEVRAGQENQFTIELSPGLGRSTEEE